MNDPKRYYAIQAYRSPYPDPIVFHKGEKVRIGREFTDDPDWTGWVWCEGERDNQAWVPKNYLKVREDRGTLLRDYNALELSVEAGERLLIHEIVNGFGMAEKKDGARGWVPIKYLERREA